MAKGASTSKLQEETEMAARAAWLHFVGGLTQSEVAIRLGVSGTRAHRLIVKAQGLGFVHISVDATAAPCVELENTLIETFGLTMCRVAMDLGEPDPIPLRALGALGGHWLGHLLEKGAYRTIGVSHGRTIAASVEAMQRRSVNGTIFVSLLGGLTRSLAANPYDVIHRLAQMTGAESYLMPAPLFANSPEDKAVLASQSMLRDAFARMQDCELAVVGIGDLKTSTGSLAVGQANITEELTQRGAAAEILGQFLDVDGNQISTSLDGRAMALPLNDLRGREVVAIAGGLGKVEAIKAALSSGLLTGLIIDEAAARSLVEGLSDGRVAGAA
ncbi:sugar-binding transcriptional regulator [Roseibium sp. MMSF_3544]|uniref:sugar-binding transcriptional regulator n=1 Tax=unclassified Roseibium TaxID=2629323 RepID=UPI00273F0409|nr:sugar-binding transcriptional regulator [Roseibium sp. MMSF_3544]